MTKSVNIDQATRRTIAGKIRDKFAITAKQQHPDETFHENITVQLVKEMFDYIITEVPPHMRRYLPHVTTNEFFRSAGGHSLPADFRIAQLSNDRDFLRYGSTLYDLDPVKHSKLIPDELKVEVDENEMLPVLFTDFPNVRGYTASADNAIRLSEEVKLKINEYNEKMENVYRPLAEQLATMLEIVESCRTTKKFEATIPQLVGLYPPSLQRKIDAANEVEEEMTEQQARIKAATRTLAAASLFENDE